MLLAKPLYKTHMIRTGQNNNYCNLFYNLIIKVAQHGLRMASPYKSKYS